MDREEHMIMSADENKYRKNKVASKSFSLSGSFCTGLIAIIGFLILPKFEVYAKFAIFVSVFSVMICLSAVNSVFSFKSPLVFILNLIGFVIIIFLVIIGLNYKKHPKISSWFAYMSSKIYCTINYNDKAMSAIEEALKLNATNYLYQMEAGKVCYKQKDFQKSIYYYNDAIELNPNDDELYLKRGCAYLEYEKSDLAIKDFEILIKNNEDVAEYNYWLGRAYFSYAEIFDVCDQYNDALKYFNNAIELEGYNDENYYWRARTYVCLGGKENTKSAIEDFTKAITYNRYNDEYYYWRGKAYYYLGKHNYNDAINNLKEAIELNNTEKEYYYWCGRVYYKIEEYGDAIENFNIAIKKDKKYAECYYRRAWTYSESGEYDKGLTDIKKAVKLDKNNPYYHNSLGNFYYNGQRYGEAVGEYENAIKKFQAETEVYQELNDIETLSECYFNLGDAYYEEGKYEKAIDAYTNAINIDNDNVLYLSRRGLCYSLIQKYDNSKEDLVTIMKLQEHGTEIGY